MGNLATKILDEIHNEMNIDEQWMNRQGNRLAWVADTLEQTFSVSEPFAFMGREAVSLECRIPVVKNTKRPAEQVCGLLSQFNYTAIGSAYVYDAEQQQVFSSFKLAVTEAELRQKCWQARIFAMLQLIMAEHQALYIAEPASGDVAGAGTARKKPDPMLDSFMEFITGRPREENRFDDPEEFAQAAELGQQVGGVNTDKGKPGATLEFRFTDASTSVATLATDLEHPTVGRGLRSFLALPISYKTNGEASLEANELNLREVAGNENGDFLGAWCIDQRSRDLSPVFTAYLPNALFAKSQMARTAVQMGLRTRICERWWFPGTQYSKTAQEIVGARVAKVHENGETKH